MPERLRLLLAALPAVLLLAAHGQAVAADPLRQIDAGGASVPIDPYYSYLIAGDEQDGVLQGLRFPLRSPLQPGELPARSGPVLEPRWLTQPIFVVGADPRSQAWVRRHQAQLRRLGASGVVVAAESAEAFKQLQRAADDLPIAPALGNWLTERLLAAGVRVLPVLIELDGHAVAAPGASDGGRS